MRNHYVVPASGIPRRYSEYTPWRLQCSLIQAHVMLATELLQLHWTLSVTNTKFIAAALTLVVSSLPLPSNYLPAIPKVGSRTPIIAPDAHGQLY